MQLLRFATAGSVDDGKSTLVGRLLHDTQSILADQYAAVAKASTDRGLNEADLALLTDGLRAEREQGITIDVAYRYFATARRNFILADTPGHIQYTRNMVTGASTADLALILVDARNGIVEQTKRHLAVTGLLRVPQVILAVNKLDLIDFDAQRFSELAAEFAQLAEQFEVNNLTAIPVSALAGDNVVHRSTRTEWYTGPTLLAALENAAVATDTVTSSFRFPVQYVIRPRTAEFADYRGYAGQISAGTVSVGDPVSILPSGQTSHVTGIDLGKGAGQITSVASAIAPQSVTLRLADEFDISRGDLMCAPDSPARVTNQIQAMIISLNTRPIEPKQRVWVRIGTRLVRGLVQSIDDHIKIADLSREPAPEQLTTNQLGTVTIKLAEPTPIDLYSQHRGTGSFLLIAESDGTTLAAGLVQRSPEEANASADNPVAWVI